MQGETERGLFEETGTPHNCAIINVGYTRQRDLALEVPPVPLSAVMSNDAWALVYKRIVELVEAHRTTLVFVNTRRMAERAARQLSEHLGSEAVAAHHGSLSREHRLKAEQRLKCGSLKVLVATASLELGIDIGDVDLVCQLGSPRSIAAFLQRVGRSGHAVGATPRGRLFPATLDDLVECTALLDSVSRDELDALIIPEQPLDVLAQQLVAELAAGEWNESALFDLVRGAWPYRNLARSDFDAVVRMLAEGFNTQRGMRSAWLHRDAVNRRLRARRNARLTALTSGGTIPDTADYAVVLEPRAQIIGSVNEDFAIESMAGDIFQLGNQSYRILRVERDRLRVEDARGMPPNIPFWIGEAPGRSDELSLAVSRLRVDIGGQLQAGGREAATRDLQQRLALSASAAEQLVAYLADTLDSLGVLPTQQQLAMERFFDESGGMQLVIHSPFGSRINRAWGLALRKRFCRNFNFELQAAATEDAIVLSLSTAHSFALEEVARYLNAKTAENVLVQALLDAPLFPVRWRWAATTALALPRFQGGKKVPAPLQRMKSEDLLGSVFPDQVACLENIVGERQIPDHPLVAQTLHDCLHEAMDSNGLLDLLRGLESGSIVMHTVDLPAPSPMAAGVLNAAPYAFLDDAPLEERRTRAVQTRHAHTAANADELGALDADAITRVREEAWPQPRNRDEMHEALMHLGGVTAAEARAHADWPRWLEALGKDHRATLLQIPENVLCHPGAAEGGGPDSPDSRHPGAAEAGTQNVSEARHPGAAEAGTQNVSDSRHPGAAEGGTRDPLFSSVMPPGFSTPSRIQDGSRVPRYARPQDDEELQASAQRQIWTAAERLPQWQTLHPHCSLQPRIAAPAEYAAQPWTTEDALRELLRARLGSLGPVVAERLAADLGVNAAAVHSALAAMQQEGSLMHGRFTPGSDSDEWCERHLLARIHRYTLGRLRREIEPVSRRDFMRFLFAWQHVGENQMLRGPDALAGVLSQLEGFEAAAGAWESEILPARVADYEPAWLDDLCRAGRLVWMRLRERASTAAARPASGPVRSTPLVLLPRRERATWAALADRHGGEDTVSSRAQAVLDTLAAQGAMFFDELAEHTRLLQTELEDALGELVAVGAINADSFAGLRALLLPASKRRHRRQRRNRRHALSGIADAGRWARIRRTDSGGEAREQHIDHLVHTLLRRYGVICWRILEREPAWLPTWRELRRVCQRLEARGDIRGGRFIDGLVGEQFALPEAVELLRKTRRSPHNEKITTISGSDPLNLVGTLLNGDKIPALATSRIAWRDGIAIAALIAGQFTPLIELDPADTASARTKLLRHAPAQSGRRPAHKPTLNSQVSDNH